MAKVSADINSIFKSDDDANADDDADNASPLTCA